MKRSLTAVFSALGCVTLTLMVSTSHAQSFDLSYSGPGISASGVLTTTPLTPPISGEYLVIGFTGERNGSPVTLIPGNPDGSPLSYSSVITGYNDVLYYPPTSQPYFDVYGLFFSSNGQVYNVYNNPPDVEIDGNGNIITLTSISVTPVPEPGTYALLGSLGLTGAAFLRRRRSRLRFPM